MSEEARTVGQRENAAFGGPVSSSFALEILPRALSLARVTRAPRASKRKMERKSGKERAGEESVADWERPRDAS